MRSLPVLLLMLPPFVTAADTGDSEMTAVRLYAGTWHLSRSSQGKPDELKNDCAQIGRFYGCQQTVNGTPGALILFIPTSTPGKLLTQNIMQNGRASGIGELQIDGNKWTFLSSWNQGSKTTRYRTTNVFTGKDKIHFEQQESDDGTHWKTTGSGDEVRVGR